MPAYAGTASATRSVGHTASRLIANLDHEQQDAEHEDDEFGIDVMVEGHDECRRTPVACTRKQTMTWP
jgi:hypothetical protein